ncbi:hypothetical protein N7481_008823 [Penicillium waksmanii]|uniref:uncharacterized protein n=1 Tax=Penicillium waksmanii TaxID=69791 RepID=UPI0025494772|nr:uncharacterized protein N7481_008823 [Penicillium waksmanii]KAJ5975116.1 hypothetical protein N7481_008823 [Penicillium waksmanii]
MAYWVFLSVSLLHSKVNVVHDKLLWTGWLVGLSIDQIAKDFSSVSPDQTWAKWISAAFSMAGRIATAEQVSSWNGRIRCCWTDRQYAEEYRWTAGNYVSSILQNATGNGDSTTLPIYTYTTYEHGTSCFFADSTILVDENKDNSSFIAAYDNFADNIVCFD